MRKAAVSSKKHLVPGIRLHLPEVPPTFKPVASDVSALELFRCNVKQRRPGRLHYKLPVQIASARGQYVFDGEGKQYLDLFGANGEIVAGHCHPLIVDALAAQGRRALSVSHYYLSAKREALAQRLIASFGAPQLNSVTFFNSAVEAFEAAALIARASTGNDAIVTFHGSYFGFTQFANAASALPAYKHAAGAFYGGAILHIPTPDSLSMQEDCSAALEQAVAQIRAATPGAVAGIFLESAQSHAGAQVYPRRFLADLAAVARARKGLAVAVEGPLAFGRAGAQWQFRHLGLAPDIVVIARGLGAGLPLAAVATAAEIADRVNERYIDNPTAGSELSIAAAIAQLDALETDDAAANAVAIGVKLRRGLVELMRKYPSVIGDVRAAGLLAGVEFIADPHAKTPDIELTNRMHEALMQRGILTGVAGRFGNVLLLSPPLCVSEDDCAYFLASLDEVLEKAVGADQIEAPMPKIPIFGTPRIARAPEEQVVQHSQMTDADDWSDERNV